MFIRHSLLLALLKRGEKLLSCQLWAMLLEPVLLGLLWKGNNLIRNDISWLAGPQLTQVPPEHLWSLQLTGMATSISGNPGVGCCQTCQKWGNSVRRSRFVILFLFFSWSFLWPLVLNCGLPSIHSFSSSVNFTPQLVTSTMPCIFLVCLAYCFSLPIRGLECEFHESMVFCLVHCCNLSAYNSAWHIVATR